MGARSGLLVMIFACTALAACSDHVVVDKGDSGTTGADDCARFCHSFDGTACGTSLDVSKCVSSCNESLVSCNAETRSFLDCSLKPGVLSCSSSGTPTFGGCEAAAATLGACEARHGTGGGGSTGSGSGGSTGSSSGGG